MSKALQTLGKFSLALLFHMPPLVTAAAVALTAACVAQAIGRAL